MTIKIFGIKPIMSLEIIEQIMSLEIIDYISTNNTEKIIDYCKNNNINRILGVFVNRVTPLFLAIDKKDIGIIRILLDNGADINQHATCYDCSPLNYAIRLGYSDIALFLIEKGANIHTIDGHGCNLLARACHFNLENIFEILIVKGVYPYTYSNLGYDLFYYINKYNRTNFIEIMIRHGCVSLAPSTKHVQFFKVDYYKYFTPKIYLEELCEKAWHPKRLFDWCFNDDERKLFNLN